ncbi:MAG: efflux RND transporter periplasmic adaptor subunit [Candidatus Omnitrophota bacterium]|jgi:multidrug efflux pump subunit AcrA (membrane-fusion protein)|nr:MAG: efflux RND transporter periplasmic adaptor subunit [Candidatus Omnitrophota bacterium]
MCIRPRKSNAIILLLGILFLSGCTAREQKKNGLSQAIPVKVMRVSLKDLAETLDYVGSVKAQDEVVVYPKVSGKIAEKVKVDGAQVAKGEPIAFIDRDEVGLKFEKSPVESPLAGIVGRVYVDIGANVAPQTPVALVVSINKVKIDLDIPERYVSQLSLGQEARVAFDAYLGKEFIGEVTQISPVLDLDTRSVPIEITIDNTEQLIKPGMFARVKLIIQEYKQVPVVLKEALIGREPDISVYVIENNKAIIRKVLVGIHQGPYWEIKEGLRENEAVVIVGQQRLYGNCLVIVEEEK